MAVARVVSFDGVSSDRVAEMQRDMQDDEQQPEGLDSTEMIMLHDRDSERSLVILFFDNQDDSARAIEFLGAIAASEARGHRCSLAELRSATG